MSERARVRVRSPVVAALAVAAAAAGAGVGAGAVSASPPGAGGHRFPARLLVYATEWSLSPSRPSVPAGRVVVQLWNRGMDPHELRARRVARAGGRLVGPARRVALTSPGAVSTARWTLGAGTWELYCSMPGHMRRGMRARLRVTR